MPLGDVCVHECVPFRTVSSGSYAQGEPSRVESTAGVPIDCLYQEIVGSREDESAPRGRRKVKQPQIMYEPWDQAGGDLSSDSDLALTAEDEVEITAPELLGDDPVRFQVVGDPTPFAPPGDVIGYQATLRRVID